MTISAVADKAGIFDILAAKTGRLAGGNARRLLLGVFLVGMHITTFLSNDATFLIRTPVVFAMVTRLRLPPLPFMFACTFIADTASFLLPVSNPINILFLDSFGEIWGFTFSICCCPPCFVSYLISPYSSSSSVPICIASIGWKTYRPPNHRTAHFSALPCWHWDALLSRSYWLLLSRYHFRW